MGLSMTHLLLVLLVAALLFGAKRFPEVMKDVAKGFKSFKKGLEEDSDSKDDSDKKPKP